MKLADIYYKAAYYFRYITSFGRFNPFTGSGRRAILNEIQYRAVEKAKEVDIPGTGDNRPKSKESQQQSGQPQTPAAYQSGEYQQRWEQHQTPAAYQSSPVAQQTPPIYSQDNFNQNFIPLDGQYPSSTRVNDPFHPEYSCKTNDALACPYPQQTIQQAPQAKFCSQCGFPVPLSVNMEIRGRRGTYQVTGLLGKRGMGRLYTGIQKNGNQPIVIKEFLLPTRCFKSLELVQQRQVTFLRVANLTSADGRDRDFRLLIPWEAIADEQERRCYLITQGNLATLPTLNTYLSNQGSMSKEQVRTLLDQMLQTLEFMHRQTFQLASGQIQQGLVHGNLSLESVLIYTQNQDDFFVYVTDLLFWEYLFFRTDTYISPKTVADDLAAVGEIAFRMLSNKGSGLDIDPRDEPHWPTVDHPLKQFILQLLGIETPFDTATNAREVLLKLPKHESTQQQQITNDEDIDQRKGAKWLPWVLAPTAIILVAMVGGGIWRVTHPTIEVKRQVLIPYIKDVNLPQGQFIYTTENNGPSNYILLTPSLLSTRRSMIDELQARVPGLQLQGTTAENEQQAAQQIQQGMANFALVSEVQPSKMDSIISKTVAYDGLLIIVPFTYAQRDTGLPKALNGKITFEQLRNLYTGKIRNWKEIGGPDLPVKLYVPTEPAAIELFEQKVLQDQGAIASFRNLIEQGQVEKLETKKTLSILQPQFEQEKIGAISFGFSSKIFGECSGYPLALQVNQDASWLAFIKQILFLGGNDAKQAIQVNNRPIDPSINLCTEKGGYRIAQNLFQTGQYPLSLPLVVLYPNDNRTEIGKKFAEMLTTQEGQELLEETNLVPLQPLK